MHYYTERYRNLLRNPNSAAFIEDSILQSIDALWEETYLKVAIATVTTWSGSEDGLHYPAHKSVKITNQIIETFIEAVKERAKK